MSNSNSNSGNQVMQSILIVIVSMSIAAIVTLLFLNQNKKNSDYSQQSSQEAISQNSTNYDETDQTIAERISIDSAKLVNSLDVKDRALRNSISERDAAVHARDGMADQMLDYKKRNQELEGQILENSQMLNKVNGLQLENEKLTKLNDEYFNQIRALKESDKSGILKASNAKLENELEGLRNQLSVLQGNIQKLRASNDNSRSNEAMLIAFKNENTELKRQLAEHRAKLNRGKLFVKEASDLNPRVASLYKALADMQGMTGEELETAYAQLQQRLSVKKLRHVKFDEGSAYVTDLEGNLIRNDLNLAQDNSFILIVGYASTTGSENLNYELSAKRATSTATVVFDAKKVNQEVKAVYLGQTNRFGVRPSENQVCEVWEVFPL